jgi:hypothetical protein
MILTSSPLPIGSKRTFLFSASWKVRVTGMEPPSRVRSGLHLKTFSTALAAATVKNHSLY